MLKSQKKRGIYEMKLETNINYMKTIKIMISQVNLKKIRQSINGFLLMTAIMCLVSVLQISAQVEMTKEQTIAYLNRIKSYKNLFSETMHIKFDNDKISVINSDTGKVKTCPYSETSLGTLNKSGEYLKFEIWCNTNQYFIGITENIVPDGDINKYLNALKNMGNPPAAWNQPPTPKTPVNSSSDSGDKGAIIVSDESARKSEEVAERNKQEREKQLEKEAKVKTATTKPNPVPLKKPVKKTPPSKKRKVRTTPQ